MKQTEQIEFAGKAYQIGFSFYAFKLFEEMTGKPITQCLDTWDNVTYFYCALKASNKESFTMAFNEYLEEMDANPSLYAGFVSSIDATTPKSKDGSKKATKKKMTSKQVFALWMLSPLLALSPVLIPVISIIVWVWTSSKLCAMFGAKAGKKRALPS